ncbi:hypothetical protein [Oribacterium sp. WCC10]|uniref:hypothetical protein n=1 Tax=Oribacterium sp. WCC10 TaxID=1855343 RepID=UPI001587E7F7|nr:hypothetical protein [Oribacterium sp. WCC10]
MNIFDSIKQEFSIPDAYENWRTYREELTACVLATKNARKMPNQSVDRVDSKRPEEGSKGTLAVLGAGPCNDLDINRLSEAFDHIDLIDIDTKSITAGLNRQNKAHDSRIDIKLMSVSGITEEMVTHFFNRLYMYIIEKGHSLTEGEFIARSLSEFQLIENFMYRDLTDFETVLPEKHYDTIIAAGLHSQLFSMISYCWHILAGNISEQLFSGRIVNPDPFHDHIREVDDRLIPLLNTAISNSARKRILLASEYDPMNPVEGAWQCIRDIRTRYTGGSISLTESTLEWPFFPEQGRKYIMLIQDIVLI